MVFHATGGPETPQIHQKMHSKTRCKNSVQQNTWKIQKLLKNGPPGKGQGGSTNQGFRLFFGSGPPWGSKRPRDFPQEPPRALQRTIFDDSGSSLGSFGHDFQVFPQTVFYQIRVTIFHVYLYLWPCFPVSPTRARWRGGRRHLDIYIYIYIFIFIHTA